MAMLRVFAVYDPKESNHIHPRDFILASSLLVRPPASDDSHYGDEVVLSSEEWKEVLEELRGHDLSNIINYMEFCEMVLDRDELETFRSKLPKQHPRGRTQGTRYQQNNDSSRSSGSSLKTVGQASRMHARESHRPPTTSSATDTRKPMSSQKTRQTESNIRQSKSLSSRRTAR
jgi:hypothetical protein